MFSKLVFVCFALTCVFAAPSPTGVVPLEKQQPTVIPIVSQSEELESNGTYKYSYETANGIKREETSFDKLVPKIQGRSGGSGETSGSDESGSDEIHVQQGSYSYTAPDGTVISVSYIADENGFRAFGDHIPTVPSLLQQVQANSGEKSGRSLKPKSAESKPAPAALTPRLASSTPVVPEKVSMDETNLPKSQENASPKAPTSIASSPVDSSAKLVEPTSTTSTSSFEQSTTSELASSVAPEQSTAAEITSTLSPENISSTSASEEISSESVSTSAPTVDASTAASTESSSRETTSSSSKSSTTESATTTSA